MEVTEAVLISVLVYVVQYTVTLKCELTKAQNARIMSNCQPTGNCYQTDRSTLASRIASPFWYVTAKLYGHKDNAPLSLEDQ